MSNYIIEQDGNAWFASTKDFTNLQESVVQFGDTPVEALRAFVRLQVGTILYGDDFAPGHDYDDGEIQMEQLVDLIVGDTHAK